MRTGGSRGHHGASKGPDKPPDRHAFSKDGDGGLESETTDRRGCTFGCTPGCTRRGDFWGRVGTGGEWSGVETDRMTKRATPWKTRGLELVGTAWNWWGLSTPRRIRTFNLPFRRPMLYPVELW